MSGSPVILRQGDPPIRSHPPGEDPRECSPPSRDQASENTRDQTQGFSRARGWRRDGQASCRSHSYREGEPPMSVTTDKSSDTTAVRPFTVPVTTEAELEAL